LQKTHGNERKVEISARRKTSDAREKIYVFRLFSGRRKELKLVIVNCASLYTRN
jgi:hypothetical protein